MKSFMLFIVVIALCFSQTVVACNGVACTALIAGCATSCACDVPACECCPLCAACLGAMWNDCCDCFSSDCGSNANNTLKDVMYSAMEAQPSNPMGYLLQKLNTGAGACYCGQFCNINCPVGQAAWCLVCGHTPMCACSLEDPCDDVTQLKC